MDKSDLPRDFQKNIVYNLMNLAVKARNDLLYAHQMIGETYYMRENYKMPIGTYSSLDYAEKKCEEATTALNEIVAHVASVYVCCKESNDGKSEQKE